MDGRGSEPEHLFTEICLMDKCLSRVSKALTLIRIFLILLFLPLFSPFPKRRLLPLLGATRKLELHLILISQRNTTELLCLDARRVAITSSKMRGPNDVLHQEIYPPHF